MRTRRDIVKAGAGLAAIIAAGRAPAALVRSMIAARNALMSGGGGWKNPYVTEGLIAMWDGEWNAGGGVHDPSATVWKDIAVGTHDIPLSSVVSSFSANSFDYISGGAYMKNSIDVVNAVWGEGYTVELIIKELESPLSDSNAMIFGGAFSRTGAFFATRDTNIRCCIRDGNGMTLSRSRNDNLSFATSYANGNYLGYLDGVRKYSIYRTPYTSSTAATYFGVGSTGSFGWVSRSGKTKFYIIRIYSRVLTAAEIAANYAVDKARFGLPDS